MKNRILFAVLLIIITMAGINGTRITTAILSLNDEKQSNIPRSSVKSEAIYLSPDEISFDPMSMVDRERSDLVNDENGNNIKYGNGSFDICDIMESMVRNISIYSEKAGYVNPVDISLRDSVYNSPNGLYYVEKHPYYNKFNNKRYVDLILDSDLNIRYINFYDGQQHSVSSDAVQRGIERFSSISVEFYSRILAKAQVDIPFWLFSETYTREMDSHFDEFGYSDYFFDPFQDVLDESLGYSGLHDFFINSACEDTIKLYLETGENNPMNLFFLTATAPVLVSFNDLKTNKFYLDGTIISDDNMFERRIYAATYFVFECNSSDFIKKQEYAAYNGRIYLTITLSDTKKIIIYNILTDEIEGFCNYYNYDGLW